MCPTIETLHIAFTAIFTTQLKNSVLTQKFYHLTIERLPVKMCTFAYGYFLLGVVTTWD